MRFWPLVFRLCGIAVLTLLLMLLLSFLLSIVASMLGREPDVFLNWVHTIFSTAVIVSVCVFAFGIDRMGFRDMGLELQGRWGELGFGLVLGGGLLLVNFLLLNALGIVVVRGVDWAGSINFLLIALIYYTPAAMAEELVCRGYILNHLSGKIYLPLLLSSLLFTALHLPGLDGFRIAGLMVTGVAYGYMYLWSGSLWLPIGVHLSWNIVLSATLGDASLGLSLLYLSVFPGTSCITAQLAGIAKPVIGLFLARWFLQRRGYLCPWRARLSTFLTPDLFVEENEAT